MQNYLYISICYMNIKVLSIGLVKYKQVVDEMWVAEDGLLVHSLCTDSQPESVLIKV